MVTNQNEYPDIVNVDSSYADREIGLTRSPDSSRWRQFTMFKRGDLAGEINNNVICREITRYVNLGQALDLHNGLFFLWETKNGNLTRVAKLAIELENGIEFDYCLDHDALSQAEYDSAIDNIVWSSRWAVGREVSIEEAKAIYEWVSDEPDRGDEFDHGDNGQIYISEESIRAAAIALAMPIEES